jgi:adenosylhomocysteine nucleosidase
MIIGVVAAMDNELRPFLNAFALIRTVEHGHNTFYLCEEKEHTLVFVCSGRGKVNAAVFTQLMITHFTPNLLLNVGVSGGIEETSRIGDLYLGCQYCHHDVRKRQSEKTFPKQLYYSGNEEMIRLFRTIEPTVKTGIFGTGEGFVADPKLKQKLYNEFQISAVDMESAAAAQCCFLNDTEYLSIRGICDKADEQATLTTEELQETISEKIVVLLQKSLDLLSSINS